MHSDDVPVRLVEWNVAMGLHSKAHLIAALQPTIAVLPEAAHTDRVKIALEAIGATATHWVGVNPHKGLLIVTFGTWALQLDDSYDPGYQWVVPLHVVGARHIRLLAVWEMDRRGAGYPEARQLGSVRASLPHYEQFLSGESDLTVITGDFNGSVVWDRPGKARNFGDLKVQLESLGFVSADHTHHGCQPGAEPHPTLWWRRKNDATYHIDYTFVSRPESVQTVTLGTYSDWIAHSDHSPMTVDLLL